MEFCSSDGKEAVLRIPRHCPRDPKLNDANNAPRMRASGPASEQNRRGSSIAGAAKIQCSRTHFIIQPLGLSYEDHSPKNVVFASEPAFRAAPDSRPALEAILCEL